VVKPRGGGGGGGGGLTYTVIHVVVEISVNKKVLK